MEASSCKCLKSMWAVFFDLVNAVERIERTVQEQHVKVWLTGYKDALVAAQERFRITQQKCCCENEDACDNRI